MSLSTRSQRLQEPVDHLLKIANATPSRRLIGLIGMPGAGKSTLAVELERAVNQATNAQTLVALGMDGFHLTKAQLRQMPDPEAAFARRGVPWTFDPHGFIQRLQMLRGLGDQPVSWPDFQHEVGDPREDAIEISPKVPIVLVEGLYLLHNADGWAAAQEQFDECWYLDTPFEVALERLTLRHMRVYGIERDEARRRITVNDELNAETVFASRLRADARLWEEVEGESTVFKLA